MPRASLGAPWFALAALVAPFASGACADAPAGGLDDPAAVSARAAGDAGGASGPDAGAAPAGSFDPLAGCPNAAATADALDVAGGAIAGTGVTSSGLPALVLSGADDGGRATFLVQGGPWTTLPAPAAPYDASYVVTARVDVTAAEAALVARADGAGAGYGLRVRGGRAEIFALSDDARALGAGDVQMSGAGEIMLRLAVHAEGDDVELDGKAWNAASPEPSAWQARWLGRAAGAPAGTIGVSMAPAAGAARGARAALAYLRVDYATADGVDGAADDAARLTSCALAYPSAPPATDGVLSPSDEGRDAADASALLGWALAGRPRRLVAVAAGTGNDMEASGAVVPCDQGKCVVALYEGIDVAFGALRAAGISEDEIADPRRTQLVAWGFGESTKGVDYTYHPAGASTPSYALAVLGLGGASAAIHGPDGAPATGAVPYVSTFAYTVQHLRDDAVRFRDALEAFAAKGNAAADHTVVAAHSWGAAYATSMLLHDMPGAPDVHVDLAITAALPKLTADFDALLSCAGSVVQEGLEGCLQGLGDVAPRQMILPGIAVGPGGVVNYRVDRPDDPIAFAPTMANLYAAFQAVLGSGGLGGHDYIVRSQSYELGACTRSGTSVQFVKDANPVAYAGIFGVGAFHLSCTLASDTLDTSCAGMQSLGGAFCKALPTGGDLCSAKPSDCN